MTWLGFSQALVVGIIVGIVFTIIKIDIPGPTKIESIIGIIGLFIGMIIVEHLKR